MVAMVVVAVGVVGVIVVAGGTTESNGDDQEIFWQCIYPP